MPTFTTATKILREGRIALNKINAEEINTVFAILMVELVHQQIQ